MKNIACIVVLVVTLLGCDNSHVLRGLSIQQEDANLSLINGVLHYENTPFTGMLNGKDQLANVKIVTQYKDGKKDGKETKVYASNQLAEERYYKRGLKVGVHKGFWHDGTPKFEFHYVNGRYHGSLKEWYANGQLVRLFHYKNGQEDGSQQMWQSNGNIRANYVVKNGERFGLIGLKKCYTVNTNEEI